MPSLSDILSPADLTGNDLQLLARGVVDGVLAGLHRSAQKGASSLFKQHRPYVPGDDLRSLDWKVYGKSDRFFVREFEEETNLRCQLLLDTSASMGYGDGPHRKLRHAVTLAACVAHLMLRQRDSVALMTFNDRVKLIRPAAATPRQLGLIADDLADLRDGPRDASNFHAAFDDLARRETRDSRRGMYAIFTDAFGDLGDLRRGLARLRHGNNEVVLFHVLHADEIEFPFRGQTRFRDLEAGGERDLDARLLRGRYLARLADWREKLSTACASAGADLVAVRTDEPIAGPLRQYLLRRARGRGRR